MKATDMNEGLEVQEFLSSIPERQFCSSKAAAKIMRLHGPRFPYDFGHTLVRTWVPGGGSQGIYSPILAVPSTFESPW